MIIEGCGVAPDLISAEFNESRAKHDPADQPPEKNDYWKRRFAPWEWSAIHEGTKEYRQETCLQQLDLPAISVPFLPDIAKRHVKEPENKQHNGVGKSSGYDTG